MANLEIREYIHRLIDEANEKQLDAVLEILEPPTNRYSVQELDSFYDRLRAFEEGGSAGFSVEQSHESIRNKYKQGGL